MHYCPNCRSRVNETDIFCRRCEFNVAQVRASLNSREEAIKAIVTQRVEGIRRRDPELIQRLIHKDGYTKFDDWPPFERQGIDGLEREAEALKVLKEYSYEISDWRMDLLDGNVALASFIIKYRGRIRDINFNIKSRVSVVLMRIKEEWKIVHEHWSRFPEKGAWMHGHLL